MKLKKQKNNKSNFTSRITVAVTVILVMFGLVKTALHLFNYFQMKNLASSSKNRLPVSQNSKPAQNSRGQVTIESVASTINNRSPASTPKPSDVDLQHLETDVSAEERAIQDRARKEGKTAIPWLMKLAARGDFLSRIAIRELASFPEPESTALIKSLMHHRNTSIAAEAIKAIMKILGEESADDLVLMTEELAKRNDGFENQLGEILLQGLGDFKNPRTSEALALEVERLKNSEFDSNYSRLIIDALNKKNDAVSHQALEKISDYLEGSILPHLQEGDSRMKSIVKLQIEDARGLTPIPPVTDEANE